MRLSFFVIPLVLTKEPTSLLLLHTEDDVYTSYAMELSE